MASCSFEIETFVYTLIIKFEENKCITVHLKINHKIELTPLIPSISSRTNPFQNGIQQFL